MGQFSSCYCCWLSDNHFYVVSMLLHSSHSHWLLCSPYFLWHVRKNIISLVFLPSQQQLWMAWFFQVRSSCWWAGTVRLRGDTEIQRPSRVIQPERKDIVKTSLFFFFFHLSLHKALINLMLTALYQQTTSWWTQGNIWCTKTLPCVCLVWM